jgi:hypothetical protein
MAYDITRLCAMPESRNFQRPNGFKFFIDNLKDVNYTVQQVAFPGASLGAANHETPFVNIPTPGDKMVFQPLTITFTLSEGLVNWLELYEWMEALGFPASYDQFNNLANIKKNKSSISTNLIKNNNDEVSDGLLIFLNSSNNPEMAFRFIDCFPVNLGSINMNVTVSDTGPITSTATFLYTSYEVLTSL